MKTNYITAGARSSLGGFRTEEQMMAAGPIQESVPAGIQSESSALLDQLVTACRRLEGVREMLHTKVAELFGPAPIPDMTPMPESEGQLGRIVNMVRSIHEQIDYIQDLVNTLRRL